MHISWVVLLGGLAAGAIFQLVSFIFNRVQQRRRARALGCGELWSPSTYGFLGITNVKNVYKADKEARLPDFLLERWQQNSRDFGGPVGALRYSLLGMEQILTVDPENLKAMLATQFADFEQGKIKRDGIVGPIFGDGIFGQDGKKWEHSRAMLRVSVVVKTSRDCADLPSPALFVIKSVIWTDSRYTSKTSSTPWRSRAMEQRLVRSSL